MTGCYTLQPAVVGAVPDAGTMVAFDLNDAGRLAMGGLMGPEIAQIEGRLIESNNGEHVVSVRAVRLLRGAVQIWSGETVRVKSEYVTSVSERRFSRGRTIALGAATIGGFTAFLVSRDLIGSGSGGKPDIPADSGVSFRVRP